MTVEDYFKANTVALDFFNLITGKNLGCGIARTVYELVTDPTLVIKFETGAGSFQNVVEWEAWQRCKNVIGIHKWFAPCVSISACGTVLIQKRVQQSNIKYPDKLPVFLTDTKRANYGVLNGKFVCCDYGTHTLHENGMTKRIRKVHWWDE